MLVNSHRVSGILLQSSSYRSFRCPFAIIVWIIYSVIENWNSFAHITVVSEKKHGNYFQFLYQSRTGVEENCLQQLITLRAFQFDSPTMTSNIRFDSIPRIIVSRGISSFMAVTLLCLSENIESVTINLLHCYWMLALSSSVLSEWVAQH